jgi:uncharacterized repeat protein (TIGR01451 family)
MPGRPAATDALTDQRPVDSGPDDVGAGAAVTDRNVHHAVVADPAHHEQIIQPLSHETEQGAAVNNAAEAASEDGTAIRYAPEPRIELASYAQPGKPGDPVPTPAECAPYPEEVLCDGGDRGLPFHYEGTTHGGLETEDTVAEFRDSDGQRQVRPSTRACVYAPRFGAVRSISQPVEEYSIARLGGAHDGVGLAGLDRGVAPDLQQQSDQLRAMQFRTRPSGVDSDAGDSDLFQVDAADQHLKFLNVYEDRAAAGEAEFAQADEAYLAHAIQQAATWNRDQNPVIVASDELGQEILAKFSAEEYIGAEDRRTPGELRIIKLADKATAKPGDILKFTIRFRNDGGRELSHVRIFDHLTPRLEYVAGSALTELDGQLTLEEEDDGSQVLTFALEQPLAGGSTGEITFECRVR